jgi:hypothetical protein
LNVVFAHRFINEILSTTAALVKSQRTKIDAKCEEVATKFTPEQQVKAFEKKHLRGLMFVEMEVGYFFFCFASASSSDV